MKCEILEDNILYFTDIIEDPKKLIEIIENTENIKKEQDIITPWIPWLSSKQSEDDDVYIYGLKKNFVTQKILPEKETNEILYIANTMKQATIQACLYYKNHKQISDDIFIYPNFAINKYKSGTIMGPHHDTQDGDKTLRFSLVTYLNDDYIGGELEFPEQKIKIKPKAGSLVIFPSTPPYLHVSNMIEDGWKYMSPSFWLHENTDGAEKYITGKEDYVSSRISR